MIELEKIEKIYNAGKATETHALKDINLRIEERDMVAITGPSGSGKSTLLHIIAGIDSPSSGEYRFCGKLVSDMSDKERCRIRNQKIGMIMQDFGLLGNDTVLRNVCLPEVIGGRYNRKFENKAKKILSAVGLSGLEQKKTNQLSGGQRQRVAFARALAPNPQLLLLDEPAAGMNPTETEELLEIINYIRNEFKVSVLLIEHDMSLVMKICERIQVLDFGTTIASGTPEQIFTCPHEPSTIKFLSMVL